MPELDPAIVVPSVVVVTTSLVSAAVFVGMVAALGSSELNDPVVTESTHSKTMEIARRQAMRTYVLRQPMLSQMMMESDASLVPAALDAIMTPNAVAARPSFAKKLRARPKHGVYMVPAPQLMMSCAIITVSTEWAPLIMNAPIAHRTWPARTILSRLKPMRVVRPPSAMNVPVVDVMVSPDNKAYSLSSRPVAATILSYEPNVELTLYTYKID